MDLQRTPSSQRLVFLLVRLDKRIVLTIRLGWFNAVKNDLSVSDAACVQVKR